MLNGIKAGAHPQAMLNIYEALITSLIMYGIMDLVGAIVNSLYAIRNSRWL